MEEGERKIGLGGRGEKFSGLSSVFCTRDVRIVRPLPLAASRMQRGVSDAGRTARCGKRPPFLRKGARARPGGRKLAHLFVRFSFMCEGLFVKP